MLKLCLFNDIEASLIEHYPTKVFSKNTPGETDSNRIWIKVRKNFTSGDRNQNEDVSLIDVEVTERIGIKPKSKEEFQ